MFFFKHDPDQIAKRGMLHALAALLYVAAVAALMTNAQALFGPDEPVFLAPVAMLMLFVLSAAVMASLVFGKPAMLYVDGKKKEAITMVAWTIGTLAVLTLGVFLFMAMQR